MSGMDPPPPPAAGAPPTYESTRPQILVAPLPDTASFFWGRTIQGDVLVKGLGEKRGSRGVKRLSVKLRLTNHLPTRTTLSLYDFPKSILYPPSAGLPTSNATSSTSPAATSSTSIEAVPFPAQHRFTIPLPTPAADRPLPGTLNLSASDKGEIRWSLIVTLEYSGGTVEEEVRIEGTPQDVLDEEGDVVDESKTEIEEVLEKDGVRTRLVMESEAPRLGDLLRFGVEVRPMERRKTGVAGLSSQPNPAETLRPLRRVRVEFFRRVEVALGEEAQSPVASGSGSGSSSTMPPDPPTRRHLTLLYTSGKSLRFPGTARLHPPLRVLFTLPTAQLGTIADQTWGEITSSTPYHTISFFIRVTIGFGSPGEIASGGSDGVRDWYLERGITVRPKIWIEPRQVIMQGGMVPTLGGSEWSDGEMTEEAAREAYRQKGRDVVGDVGTYRADQAAGQPGGDDLPPPFEGAGPSGRRGEPPLGTSPNGLPTFLESEAQMRAGDIPLPVEGVLSERLVPVQFDDDRLTSVGRRGSLGGELGTWVEYDGYETFSVAPPSVEASFGAGGSMDPPQEGDEDVNVIGGMVARLGFGEAGRGVRPGGQVELMEQLGLGEGTRVVDLQDDLPPGIDEPSLPALPTFRTSNYSPPQQIHSDIPPPTISGSQTPNHEHPPSFAASEAAQALGSTASSVLVPSLTSQRRASRAGTDPPMPGPASPIGISVPITTVPEQMHPQGTQAGDGPVEGDAPPGYFGVNVPMTMGQGGLPPYTH